MGLAVCSAAAILVVLAFSGVAMISSMHSRLTPERIAEAAIARMSSASGDALLPSSLLAASGASRGGPSSAVAGFGQHLFMLGDPEVSLWSRLADSMLINYRPLYRKLAAKLSKSADVFSSVASDLASEGASKGGSDAVALALGMLPGIAADVSAALRTAASFFEMEGNINPPPPSHEVKPEDVAGQQSLLSFFFGVNPITDSDGDASMPLAIWLEKMADPAEIGKLASACADLTDAMIEANMEMKTYSQTAMNTWTNQCEQPSSVQALLVDAGIPAMGDTSKADCKRNPSVSSICTCEATMSFDNTKSVAKVVRDVCVKLRDSLSSRT